MKRFTWAVVALMALTAPLAAQGTYSLKVAPADTNRNSGAYVGIAPAEGALAVTACGNDGTPGEPTHPIIHYRPDVPMDTLLAAEVTAHEMVHVAQMTPDSNGTCEQKQAAIIATPFTLMNAEAPAYCAQIKTALALRPYGTDDLPAYQRLIFAMTAYLNAHYTPNDSTTGPILPGDVAHILLSYCKPQSVTYSDGSN